MNKSEPIVKQKIYSWTIVEYVECISWQYFIWFF